MARLRTLKDARRHTPEVVPLLELLGTAWRWRKRGGRFVFVHDPTEAWWQANTDWVANLRTLDPRVLMRLTGPVNQWVAEGGRGQMVVHMFDVNGRLACVPAAVGDATPPAPLWENVQPMPNEQPTPHDPLDAVAPLPTAAR